MRGFSAVPGSAHAHVKERHPCEAATPCEAAGEPAKRDGPRGEGAGSRAACVNGRLFPRAAAMQIGAMCP